MSEVMPVLYAVMGFILVASVIAIEAKDLLSTVISISAAGAGVAIVFLLLRAPDLAITAVVVEVVSRFRPKLSPDSGPRTRAV